MLSFDEYIDVVLETYETQPHWRIGQCHFVVFAGSRSDLVDALIDDKPDLDPFYDDTRVPAFVAWLKENW